MLPAQFSELEPYLGWALPGDEERARRRMASTVEEITAMYQAVLPHFPAIMAHLGTVDPRTMSDEDRSLLCLVVAFVESADSVEYYAPTGLLGPDDLLRFKAAHDLLGLKLGRPVSA